MITCDAYFWLIHITSKTTSIFCKIPFKHVCSSLVRRLMNRLIHLRVEVILIYIYIYIYICYHTAKENYGFFILLYNARIVQESSGIDVS